MNFIDAHPALIPTALTILGWIGVILWRIFKSGQAIGEADADIKNVKQDIETLYQSISVNNNMQNDRYEEFYKEFESFRRKIAKELGINGN